MYLDPLLWRFTVGVRLRIVGAVLIGLVAAAFGSFGWTGEASKHLHAMLEEIGLTMVADPLRVNYVPAAPALLKCRKLGETVAKKLRETCND